MGIKIVNLPQELDALEAQCAKDALAFYEPRAKHTQFFYGLCLFYLIASEYEKQQVKALIADKEGIQNNLLGYAYKCAQQIQTTGNNDWLRIGLAATVLAEEKTDYRDMLLARAELYVIAEEAELDPQSEFKTIVKIDGFDRYAVVKSRRSGTHRSTPD